MKYIRLDYFLLLFMVNVLTSYSQDSFVFNGQIMDINAGLPLQDVKIYCINNSDTTETSSNKKGEFQISIQAGSKLFLKKPGFAWHFVKIYNNDERKIYLTPSKNYSEKDIGKQNFDTTDFYFNDHLVPQDEWDDASSIDQSMVRSINAYSSKTTNDKRNKIYIYTID